MKRRIFKKPNFRERVLAAYALYDDDGISTQTLLQMVADECKCDVDDVAIILMEEGDGED